MRPISSESPPLWPNPPGRFRSLVYPRCLLGLIPRLTCSRDAVLTSRATREITGLSLLKGHFRKRQKLWKRTRNNNSPASDQEQILLPSSGVVSFDARFEKEWLRGELEPYSCINDAQRLCGGREQNTPQSIELHTTREGEHGEIEREDGQSVLELFRDKRKRYGVKKQTIKDTRGAI